MPPRWGRPPWGASRSERNRWERERAAAQAAWEEEQEYRYGRSQAAAAGAARFEELETEDSDDGHHGVLLAGHYKDGQVDSQGYGPGMTLRRRSDHDRRRFDFDDVEEEADGRTISLDDQDELGGDAFQLALRDKEEELVKRALERIRRARMMGKKNIRLPAPEHEALQRKIEKDRKAAEKEIKAKPKQPTLTSKKSADIRKGSNKATSSALVPAGKRKGSRTSLNQVEVPPARPLEYYDQPGSRPQSRPRAATGSRAVTPVGARRASDQAYYPSPARRPLPDDPNWQPRSRSNSNLAYDRDMAYGFDPYGYPARSDSRPGSRRNTSGPAELGYPNIASQPRAANAALAQARAYGSDPAFSRDHGHRVSAGSASRYFTGYSDEDDDEDNSSNEGVQVDVRAFGSDFVTTDTTASNVRQTSPKKQPAGRSRRNTGRR